MWLHSKFLSFCHWVIFFAEEVVYYFEKLFVISELVQIFLLERLIELLIDCRLRKAPSANAIDSLWEYCFNLCPTYCLTNMKRDIHIFISIISVSNAPINGKKLWIGLFGIASSIITIWVAMTTMLEQDRISAHLMENVKGFDTILASNQSVTHYKDESKDPISATKLCFQRVEAVFKWL